MVIRGTIEYNIRKRIGGLCYYSKRMVTCSLKADCCDKRNLRLEVAFKYVILFIQRQKLRI